MSYAYLGLGSMLLGYVIYLVVYKFLPQKLKADERTQREEIVADARRQATARKKSEAERLEEEAQIAAEQFEADLHERQEDAKLAEEDHNSRERSIQLEEA